MEDTIPSSWESAETYIARLMTTTIDSMAYDFKKLAERFAKRVKIEGKTVKVIVVGSTDEIEIRKSMDDQHIPQTYIDQMPINRAKAASSANPFVFAIHTDDKTGELGVDASLPLDGWSSSMHIEHAIQRSKNLQRLTDWSAGFLEVMTFNHSVLGIEVATGALWIGDTDVLSDQLLKSMENSLDAIERKPTVPRAQMMKDAKDLDLGQMLQGLASLLEKHGIDTGKVKEEVVVYDQQGVQDEFEPPANPVEVKKVEAKKKKEDTKLALKRKEQQDIVARYGWEALEELSTRTKQPIVIDKPDAV